MKKFFFSPYNLIWIGVVYCLFYWIGGLEMVLSGAMLIPITVGFIIKFIFSLFKSCPHCGKSINHNATKCEYCTANL